MPVIKADKIANSRKLNEPAADGKAISTEAFWAYAYFVSRLRDDFGRFRYNARTALSVLAPKNLEITEGEVSRILDEYRRVGLLRVWEVDGVAFAEWWNPSHTRAPRFHATPEPPSKEDDGWPKHEHGGWCLTTAIRQARLWDRPEAETLSLQLKGLRDNKDDNKEDSRADNRQHNRPDTPSSSSSSSSSVRTTEPTDLPDAAGGRAGDRGSAIPPAPPPPASAIGPETGLLDHDATDPTESALAHRIAHLATLTGDPPLEILAAVSSTPKGKSLDGIRGRPKRWLETTLSACSRFEFDLGGAESPPEEPSPRSDAMTPIASVLGRGLKDLIPEDPGEVERDKLRRDVERLRAGLPKGSA